MAAYEYLALDHGGRSRKGVLTGESSRQVRAMLRELGLIPMEVCCVNDSSRQGRRSRVRQSMPAAGLALMTRQLATLISAGMPLEQSLRALGEQSGSRRQQSILAGIRAEISEGAALHEALGKYPGAFPDLYRVMIEAGDASGKLEAVLNKLADYTEARHALGQKLAMAMIYPCLLTMVAVVIVMSMLTYVVPQVVMVFEQTGQQLPFLTRSLILSSRIITDYGLALTALLGGVIFTGYYLLRKRGIRRKWDLLLLQLPLIGRIILTLNTARLARTMTILVDSGVPVLEALKIGSRVIRNLPLREVLDATVVSVREGGRLHSALDQGHLFPPLFIHLLAAGEDSGELEAMLGRAADHQEQELESALTVATSILEPMIILFMGTVVLLIVLAILTPIFEMNQLVGS